MTTPQTPGVYVEEISTLPPSVADVATAIPAFLGYTERGPKNKPTRITSMLEYTDPLLFGKAQPTTFEFDDLDQVKVKSSEPNAIPNVPDFLMYYSLKLYFDNGGGPCYIVSVGHYGDADTPSKSHFTDGLASLARVDEPTLIVLTDAVKLAPDDYKTVCQQAFAQCVALKDRMVLLDVLDGNAADFRDSIPSETSTLMYGAAYYPYLRTTLNHEYDEAEVTSSATPNETLATIKSTHTTRYQQIKRALAAQRVTLPPSAAIAGIYARVDRERGVWKAPANVSINSVIGPTLSITSAEQAGLNVDATSGKSINAIRSFTGKGTLVWGARTLAGNDNEWRYVNVRRLFIMIEESIQKATAFAVFEANDATTWLKVKGMIESFLYGLWEQGALAGPKPESAYFVNVGLNRTMTTADINAGIMNVEIGVAAVRPAEFIMLKFSHKMQEA